MEDPFIGRFDKIPFLVNSSKMDLLIQWSFLSDVDKMKSPSTSLSSQSTFIAILSQADPGPATPIRIFFFFDKLLQSDFLHQPSPSISTLCLCNNCNGHNLRQRGGSVGYCDNKNNPEPQTTKIWVASLKQVVLAHVHSSLLTRQDVVKRPSFSDPIFFSLFYSYMSCFPP